METSIYIAQFLGPILTLIWIRLLFSKDFFQEAKSWMNEWLSLFFISILWVIWWILIVTNHNIWIYSWEVIITFIWWAMLIKSSMLIAFPKIFKYIMDKITYPNWLMKIFWLLYIIFWRYMIYEAFIK